MKRSITPVILLLAIMLVLVTTTSASVPPAMSYQGRLLDAGGDPVADGDHPIRFGLSTEPNNEPFWYSPDMTVTTTDGLFTAFLGFDPSDVSMFRDHAMLFLSITIGGEVGEMLPRTLVTTSPFAFHAQHADTADFVVNSNDTPSGWVDQGDVVTLETSADTVKIGSVTEPGRLYLYGPTAEVSFDLSVYGDGSVNVPYGAISAIETLNEAGGGFDTLSGGGMTVGTGVTPIVSRVMTFPTSGYALVIGTAELSIHHPASSSTSVTFGTSMNPTVFANNQKYTWAIDFNEPTGNHFDIVTVHGFFNVPAGLSTFYLLGQTVGSQTGNIYEAQITVLFVPTTYRMNPKESSASLPDIGGRDEFDANQLPQDALLREMVKRETASIRAELDAIQRQMLELLGGQSIDNAEE